MSLTDPSSPTRLGVWDEIVPQFARRGWITPDGRTVPAAVPLLRSLRSGPEPQVALERLARLIDQAPQLSADALADPETGRALVALVGVSRALSRTLAVHPEWLAETFGEPADFVDSPEPDVEGRLAALRLFVRRRLLRTAARDLLDLADMPQVGRELSDTADAAAEVALRVAIEGARSRDDYANLPDIPMAVIAMGKWGGRELNYASDIDVLFVYQPPDQLPSATAAGYARRVAEGFMSALGAVTPEGIAFRVDADLRPEGKDGPLARSLDSYRTYYQKWAATWEYQALLKARPAAGDPTLGRAFLTMIEPFVYPDTLSPDAIRDIRTMKARIEAERLPPDQDPEFQVKLGRGGLVDVEFAVQLLQLKHGRRIPDLRVPGTMEAVAVLRRESLLPASDLDALAQSYEFCGRLRNRLFLQAGRPVDALPTDPERLAQLGSSLGYLEHPRLSLREEYRRRTRRARRVVERRFYRD